MDKKYAGLQSMTESDFFTIEMCLQHINKSLKDADALEILIKKLKTYPIETITFYMTEIVFFMLKNNCRKLIAFLIELCVLDFRHYFIIINLIDVWGYQFSQKNNKVKKEIRSILEDCETSMVNGEVCLANYRSKDDKKQKSNKQTLTQEELYKFVIGKRSKNDFKDDVRYFANYIVKLSYLLLTKEESKIRKLAVEYLHKLNLYLYERRAVNNDPDNSFRFMYQGVSLPFRENPDSDMVD